MGVHLSLSEEDSAAFAGAGKSSLINSQSSTAGLGRGTGTGRVRVRVRVRSIAIGESGVEMRVRLRSRLSIQSHRWFLSSELFCSVSLQFFCVHVPTSAQGEDEDEGEGEDKDKDEGEVEGTNAYAYGGEIVRVCSGTGERRDVRCVCVCVKESTTSSPNRPSYPLSASMEDIDADACTHAPPGYVWP